MRSMLRRLPAHLGAEEKIKNRAILRQIRIPASSLLKEQTQAVPSADQRLAALYLVLRDLLFQLR